MSSIHHITIDHSCTKQTYPINEVFLFNKNQTLLDNYSITRTTQLPSLTVPTPFLFFFFLLDTFTPASAHT